MNALDPQVVEAVESATRSIYAEVIDPIAERFAFEASPPASETSGLPLVLFLGNHSSGKSSFINFLVGGEVQRTGIAPVDDGFTIITHGDPPEDKDGAAVVTNPQLHWGDLERFGGKFLGHLVLRLRPLERLKGIALVDSPGMIDAADARTERAYDFPAVVRWFAERADVILLLFDPDKPGTTGETLKILTDSLAGLDHKLLVIFNKVDRFRSMRDFARAYGALCWNLSKAIPTKDLPHIYNTYLPVPDAHTDGGLPLDDFDRSREEVLAEVLRAPQRRLDNVISRLHQHARRLRVHARVIDTLVAERRMRLFRSALLGLAVVLVAGLAVWGSLNFLESEELRLRWVGLELLASLLALGVVYGLWWWDERVHAKNLSLDALFERTYARELTLGDQAHDLRALWASVRDRTQRALVASEGKLPRLGRGELRRLDKVIEHRVPELRSQAAQAIRSAEAAGGRPAERAEDAAAGESPSPSEGGEGPAEGATPPTAEGAGTPGRDESPAPAETESTPPGAGNA